MPKLLIKESFLGNERKREEASKNAPLTFNN
jgi:hypothetical protein